MLKNKSLIKLVTMLAILVVGVGMLTGCGKSGTKDYEEPIKNLVEALAEADSEKFLSAFPSFISKVMENTFTKEYMETVLKELEEQYGANIQRSYEVKKAKELSADELETTKNAMKDVYDADITITKGYAVDTRIKTKGDKLEDIEEHTFYVYQVDGKWYLFSV